MAHDTPYPSPVPLTPIAWTLEEQRQVAQARQLVEKFAEMCASDLYRLPPAVLAVAMTEHVALSLAAAFAGEQTVQCRAFLQTIVETMVQAYDGHCRILESPGARHLFEARSRRRC